LRRFSSEKNDGFSLMSQSTAWMRIVEGSSGELYIIIVPARAS